MPYWGQIISKVTCFCTSANSHIVFLNIDMFRLYDFRNTLTHLLSMHCYALSANGSASKHYDAVKQSLFWAVQPDFSGTIKH